MHQKVESHLSAEQGLKYRLIRHADFKEVIASPHDFSRLSGVPLERITKTLLVKTKSGDRKYAVIVCPIARNFDLSRVGEVLVGAPVKISVASPEELEHILEYPTRGVSPLGVGDIPVIVDISVMEHETVCVGTGMVGEEIEISPALLVSITHARVETVCKA